MVNCQCYAARPTTAASLSAAAFLLRRATTVLLCYQIGTCAAFQLHPPPTPTVHRSRESATALHFFPTQPTLTTTHVVTRRLVESSCSGGAVVVALQQHRKRGSYEDDDEEDDEDDVDPNVPVFPQASPLLQDTSRALRRVSFFSWWSQVILTTTSGVILGFARRVTFSGIRDAAIRGSDPSFVLSGIGLAFSAVSILWTWGNGARLSRRLTRRPVSSIVAAQMLRRAVRVGVTLNLVGLLVHLLAAEEIVGTLAIRVLTSSPARQAMMFSGAMEGLQPLDVLVVQANTNALLSHFCSLCSLLFLTGPIDKLDPPSTEESGERRGLLSR